MLEILENCTLCPHECKVNRKNGKIGRCKSKDTVKIALYSTHNFEEPCISGNNGSGTVFFSNCNLNCIYCQNYEISQKRQRKRNINRRISWYFYKTTKKRSREHKFSNSNKLCAANNRSNKNCKKRWIKITNCI